MVDEEQRQAYRRRTLSPSTAKAVSGCPARWAAEKALPRAEDPFGAAELGTSAHTVLEDLYDTEQTDAADRTPERAMSILLAHSRQQWPGADERTHAKRGLWICAVHGAYKGIFDIEDPTQVTVRDREIGVGTPDGPDIEIHGVPFTGYIDRVDHTDDGVRLLDYKSSAKKPRVKFGDDHGDQVRLYHEVLRVLDGTAPAAASLYYTRLGIERVVPTSPSAMRKTLNAFKRSWATLNTFVDNGAFPTKASPLCGWCPLVNACPAAAANGNQARVDHAPGRSDLGIPILRRYDDGDLHAIGHGRDTDRDTGRARTRTPSMDLDFGSASNGATHDQADCDPADVPDGELGLPDGPSKVVPVDTIDSGYQPPEDQTAEDYLHVKDLGVDVAAGAAGGAAAREGTVSDPAGSAYLKTNTNETDTANKETVDDDRPTDQHEKGTDMSDLLHESKPYHECANGTLNPNSYAAIAVFGTATWAYEEIHKAGLKPNRAMIDGLAQTLAYIVAQGQEALTGAESYQEGANTRLRGALRAYIEAHPIPFGGDVASWDEWVRLGVRHTRSIADAALRLYDADLAGQPWTALAIQPVAKSA